MGRCSRRRERQHTWVTQCASALLLVGCLLAFVPRESHAQLVDTLCEDVLCVSGSAYSVIDVQINDTDVEQECACIPCEAGTSSLLVNSTTCSTCPRGSFSLAGATECISCPALSSTVTTRTTSQQGCVCSEGAYRNDEGTCVECVVGGVCAGGDAAPIAAAGYYEDPNAVGRPIFLECVPAGACLGGNFSACADGYTGLVCGTVRPAIIAMITDVLVRTDFHDHDCGDDGYML